MVKVTVLVTGVGGGVGQSIIKGLNLSVERRGDIEYKIIGVDADPLASGLYRTKGYIVPKASKSDYIERLIEIANTEGVDVIIPGSDPEVLEVARNKKKLEKKTGMKVLTSSPDAVEIGLDKWKTFQFLKKNNFSTPLTALPESVNKLLDKKDFPLVVKPRRGSASLGLFIVNSEKELDYAISESDKEIIVQEYLIPENWKNVTRQKLRLQIDEFSTEVIVSKEGRIIASITNWRKMVKGIPKIAIIKPFGEVKKACEKVTDCMHALGPVNLQARVTEKGPTFFEINTRFSGSTAVRCFAGFNGPDTMIRDVVLGQESSPDDLKFDNLIEMRYNNEVYITENEYNRLLKDGKITSNGHIPKYF